MPATRLNLPLKYLIASSDPITASHSLSVERNTYFGLAIVSLTPSWVVPSHITSSACSSSATGATPRLTPVEINPCAASTFSCRIKRRKRSMVSFGLVSSSNTSSILRPAMPPSLFIRSAAHWTPRIPHSPAVPAAPDRGAIIPIRKGLSCASAGADIRGAAATRTPVPANLEKSRRVSFIGASHHDARLPARCDWHTINISVTSHQALFSGLDASKNALSPNRLVIYYTSPTICWRRCDGTDIKPDDRSAAELPRNLSAPHRRMVQWLAPRLCDLCNRIHGAIGLFRQRQQLALVGAGDRSGDVPVRKFFRMVDSPLRHAPALAGEGVPGDLQQAYADASSVLHRTGDAFCQSQ